MDKLQAIKVVTESFLRGDEREVIEGQMYECDGLTLHYRRDDESAVVIVDDEGLKHTLTSDEADALSIAVWN